MLAMVWVTGEPLPPRTDLLWGAFAGFAGAFGIAALYRALAIGRMGVIAPVASVVTGILPVLVGFRTEGLPDRIQLLGFALALVSIWLVARPNEQIDSHRGLGLAVLAGVTFGLFLIASKQAGHHGVFWPLVAARAVSTTLMSVIVAFTPRDPRPFAACFGRWCGPGCWIQPAMRCSLQPRDTGDWMSPPFFRRFIQRVPVILARVMLKERISPMQGAGIVGAMISVALISMR